MIKRLISGALSLLICSSMFTSEGIGQKPKSTAPQADNPVSSDMDYKISSTNSLGNYISDAMNSQNSLNASASNVQVNEGYAINNFGFDNQTGEVIVKSTQPQNCTVLVTILEEETNKKACEVKAEVEKGENVITTAKIDISLLPQYYVVKVELVDKKGKSLCSPFTKTTYTKEMQEIIATDIHDFDEEYVVNFDESENTNFLVLSEETVKAESTDETNTLSSADYENGIFVFDNADETLKNLEEGESLFIQPNENDIIAVSVDKVEINENNQLVIEGNDENVDEMFDFIKFETSADDVQTIVDTSAADEGISFPDLDDKIKQHTLATGAPLNFQYSNKQAKASGSLTVPLDFGKEDADYNRLDDIKDNLIDDEDRVYDDDDDKDDKDDSFDISTSGNLKFQTQINFYKKGFSVKIEFTIEVGLELEAKVGWEKEKKHTIQNEKMNSFSIKVADLSIKTAIPGVCINVEPKIVVDFSASISITVSSSLKFGFTYDSKKKKFQKISEVSPLDYSIDVEGTLELKLVLDPSVVFVSKKIAYATFEAAAGFALEATTEVRKEMADHVNNSSESGEVLILNKSDDSTHGCMACLDGQLDFFVSADAKLSFIGKKIEAELLKLTFPIGVIHISSDTGFGWGECDYERYRVSFDVYDIKTAAPISGALITLEDLENYTDSSGLASYYCDNTGSSSYKYSVKIGDETVGSGYITVDDAPQTVCIKVSVEEDDEGNKTYSGADSDVAKGEARSTAAPATKPVMTGVTIATAEPIIEHKILSSGKLGDNIDFILHDDGNLWIYGYGDMYDDLSNPFESPESVKVVDFEHEDEENGYTINSIGNNVFMGCKNLPEISIPQTVTRIGECAFYGCSALQFGDLVFSSELTSIGRRAFNDCAGLTSVEVSGTVKTIGDYAFENCTSLKSAIIKDGVETLGNHMFNVCTALEEVTLPYAGSSLAAVNQADSSEYVSSILFRNGVENSLKKITITGGTRIPNNAFNGFGLVEEIVLPDTITSIGDDAFFNCSSLTSVNLTNKLVSIGDSAFLGCSALQFGDLVLPSELTSIGRGAFNGCTGLTSVVVPGTVKTIGDYAFFNCTSLKSAVIKDGVENLGNHMFNVCTALEEVTLPYAGSSLTAVNKSDSSENVSAILFRNSVEGKTYNTMYYPVPNSLKKITITGGTRIPNNAFKGFGLVEEIVLPDTITSIGDDAFFNCSSLTSVNLTNKLVSIGDSAFLGCSALQFGDLVLPSELTSIGRGAFDGCTGLTSVEVPGTVKTIGDYAFFNCTSLKSAVIKDGVENLGNHMFNVCTALEEVTLPYAGSSLAAVNQADSSEYVSSILFRNGVENSLKKITITGGTRIPNNAFNGFGLVEEIVLPDSVASIGLDAFDECEALSEITIYNPDCEIYPDKSTIPEKTIIYGYKDSTAESYALEYDREFKVIESNPDVTTPVITTTQPTTTTVVPEIKPTLYGDANCDGHVSIADATAIFQGLGNPDKYLLSPQGMANGDCFKTGSGITLSDALAIQMYDAKLISNLPVSELPVQR